MSGKYRRNNKKGTGKKILILIFVLISLFCIIFFSARGRFKAPVAEQAVSIVLTPFQRAISWVGSQLNYVTSNIWEIATMHEQNKMLRNEDVREFYLGFGEGGSRKNMRDVKHYKRRKRWLS